MKLFKLLLLSSFFTFNLSAQTDTTKYLEIEFFVPIWPSALGDTVVNEAYVQAELDQLNTAFAANNTGIQFVMCGEIHFIDDPNGIYASGDNNAPYGIHEKRGAIHVWNCTVLAGGVSGLATPGEARIRLNGIAATRTIEHEMGHILGLSHTHVPSDNELVDGSNCTTAGDYLCDTPADPGLSTSNVNSNCIYTGTATDANGDPYNPLTNNFMSYSRYTCRSAFTQQQVDKMNQYLNTTGFFINRVNKFRMLQPMPTEFCDSDTVGYNLISLEPGATISGPGVVGTIFYPNQAGAGVHEFLCDFPTDTILYHDFVTAETGGSQSTMDAWNSYSVDNGGLLKKIYYRLNTSTSNIFTIEVRQGSGVLGTLLHTELYTIPATNGLAWVEFAIATNLNLSTAQTYTFRIFSGTPFTIGSNIYAYPGSNSNITPQQAYPFKNLYSMVTEMEGLEPCGSIGYRYVEVHSPDNGSMVTLKDEYCNTLDYAIQLTGTPSNGIFYIDNVQDSILNFQNLGIGNHTVQFISTDENGCPGFLEHNFTITDFSATVSPSIDPVYCINNSPITVTGEPAGGFVLIDGDTLNSIDFSSLGFGTHMLSYEVSSPFDTITIQGPTNPPLATSPYFYPLQDSIYWQSFTSDSSGFLNNISLFGNIYVGHIFESTLYKGTPDQNIVLYLDTHTVTFIESYKQLFDTIPGIFIDADSIYSFSFKWLGPSWPAMYIPHSVNDAYLQGISSLDSSGIPQFDFVFNTTLDQHRYCQDIYTTTFEVDSCSVGLNEESLFSDLRIFPNPASDKVTIQSSFTIESVEIMNLHGQLIVRHEIGTNEESIFIGNLSPGTYIINVNCENGSFKSRLIKE